MSIVTNLILSYSIMEDDDVLDHVNDFLVPREEGKFSELCDSCVAGSKRLERPTFIGAFNYFDLKSFIVHLEGICWQEPEHVQLFACEQEDNAYRQMQLFSGAEGSPEWFRKNTSLD